MVRNNNNRRKIRVQENNLGSKKLRKNKVPRLFRIKTRRINRNG